MIPESQIAQVINNILDREGGYSNDPNDRGGATNFGITQATADDFAVGSVDNLTRDRAVGIYRRLLADWHVDQIPEYNLMNLVADCCVNSGSGRGVKWLQRAIGILDDGILGPQTLAALTTALTVPRGAEATYAAVMSLRIQFYGALITNDASQARYAHGWLNRAASFLRPWPFGT